MQASEWIALLGVIATAIGIIATAAIVSISIIISTRCHREQQAAENLRHNQELD